MTQPTTPDELQLTHDELLQAFDTAEHVGAQLDELARSTDDVALYRARDHARRAAGCLGAALAALQLHRQPREAADDVLYGTPRPVDTLPPVPPRHRAAESPDSLVAVEPTELLALTSGSNNDGPRWDAVDTRTRPEVDHHLPTVELTRIDTDEPDNDEATDDRQARGEALAGLPTTELSLMSAYGLAEAVEPRDLGRC